MTATPVPVRRGHVSVVIVNYRGADDTIACIAGVREMDWPSDQLQIIVVDNDSGDGSADRIAAAAPEVLLIRSPANTGFAGGCNLGVAAAEGEFVAFINSDARPHVDWVREAVAVLDSDLLVGAVASKVLDWRGERIDFVGGNINFAGQGYKLEAGALDDGSYDTQRDVLFFTGSAAVVRTDTFRKLGGFDERYFMFFEDVDLGWRMNLRGYRVRYVPGSVVYHKHHAAIDKFGSYREQYLLARNSLITIYKNFSDETLRRAFAPALLSAVHNAALIGGDDVDVLDLQRTPRGDEHTEISVSKASLVGPYAIEYLTRHLAEIDAQRCEIQRSRVRSDVSLGPLFGDLLRRTSPAPEYAKAWDAIIAAFQMHDLVERRLRVAVLTADTLAARMAGPAIRAFHMAQALSVEHDVRLVSTTECTIASDGFQCMFAGAAQMKEIVAWSDVVVFQGFIMHEFPWLARTDKIIVVDIYDPMHLEQLEQSRADSMEHRTVIVGATVDVLNRQLARGDFFLCASEEQRHFWLGQLAGVGRLNPRIYDRDSSLDSLVAVVPFGMPDTPPARSRQAIKGVVPGIASDDKVILWGGGVYNWFDPLTVISAVDRLRHDHPEVRLFFMGMKHPNPHVPEMRMAWECRELSDRLGLTDKHVFFNEQWVDYDDRANYLLDADVGVSAHFLHVETTFSFRTRILDYLWASLPIVATEGDTFAKLIREEGLGSTVPEKDVNAMAGALERALYDSQFASECKDNIARVRTRFAWSSTLEPLKEFCRAPVRAADADMAAPQGGGASLHAVRRGRFGRNAKYAAVRYREGGLPLVWRLGVAKARRLLSHARDLP